MIGAGAAGLSAAAMLAERGVPALVLERDSIASSWRGRYDRLRLHTPRLLSGLPGMRIPRRFGRWVTRDDLIEYFRPEDKRATMLVNLRNIFARMQPTTQDIQTLHGIVAALTEGRKGPARGGVLDGEEAKALRALLAEYGEARAPGEGGPVRGLARLLRRNPTEAERMLWQALTTDRRFAGQGFKRQVPVGTHITDFVSFPLRVVIDLKPARESEIAARARSDRRAWLIERGYRVLDVEAGAVDADPAQAIDRLAQAVAGESNKI